MDAERGLAAARTLTEQFAQATGLVSPDVESRRYLWTDAFAVCNFLELFRQTGDDRYRDLSVALVDAVHRELARHRPDDVRSGWISGLDEAEGTVRPLAGGLRIGKPLPERPAEAPHDEREEWDCDGQYYHYLTKWMHALSRMSVVLDDATYRRHAIDLAQAAHRGFMQPGTSRRAPHLAWKMSIDLSRPLVPFSGHHDPLDGLVTYLEVAGTGGGLEAEVDSLSGMCVGVSWATEDPLGIGGLLFDAARIAQLPRAEPLAQLLVDVLEGARLGLTAYVRSGAVQQPPAYRLAFRELGLSIGLHALDRILDHAHLDRQARLCANTLRSFQSLATTIEDCWMQPRHRATPVWMDHEDINTVMLATSLLPDGFLGV